MKLGFLSLVLSLGLSNTILASSTELSSFLVDGIEQTCLSGQRIGIEEFQEMITKIGVNNDNGCDLYEAKIYPGDGPAKLLTFGDYRGDALILKLIHNQEQNAHLASLRFRDKELCFNQFSEDDYDVAYRLDLAINRSWSSSKAFSSFSFIRVRNNMIHFAGQASYQVNRSKLIFLDAKLNEQFCGFMN